MKLILSIRVKKHSISLLRYLTGKVVFLGNSYSFSKDHLTLYEVLINFISLMEKNEDLRRKFQKDLKILKKCLNRFSDLNQQDFEINFEKFQKSVKVSLKGFYLHREQTISVSRKKDPYTVIFSPNFTQKKVPKPDRIKGYRDKGTASKPGDTTVGWKDQSQFLIGAKYEIKKAFLEDLREFYGTDYQRLEILDIIEVKRSLKKIEAAQSKAELEKLLMQMYRGNIKLVS